MEKTKKLEIEQSASILSQKLESSIYSCHDGTKSLKPTKQSISKVETHFGIKLPKSYVYFARHCENFENWFAGIGDYQRQYNHIIRVNKRYKRIRRRRQGRWKNLKPESLVIIGADLHDVCICFDKNRYDEETGEYGLQYWLCLYEQEYGYDFPDFMSYIDYLIDVLDD